MNVGDREARGPVHPILGLLVPITLLLLVVSGCASKAQPQATAAASAPGTASVTFHAFTRSGELSVPVGDVVRGQCWTTSIAAPVAGAYRCFQGDKILDPCFAPAHRTTPVELACMADPWSRALMLQVSGALPEPGAAGTPTRPWAFQLSNSVRCVASTGTVPEVGGVNLGYHCTDGGDAALIPTGGSLVSAHYAAPGATTLTTMTVTTIWHA
jgi:hypothetical protein